MAPVEALKLNCAAVGGSERGQRVALGGIGVSDQSVLRRVCG